MSKIPSSEEQELSKLSPAALDEGFLARLTASAEGTAEELTSEEMNFEARLRRIKPRNAPSTFNASLLETLSAAPFAVDEKIVLFNGKIRTEAKTGKSNIFRFNIAAAAAVALLGSIAAFMVPQNGGSTPITADNNSSTSLDEVAVPYVPSSKYYTNLSTASFVSETEDVIPTWSYPMQQQSSTYFDELTGEGEGLNNVNTKQPRMKFGIIPMSRD